MKTINDIITNKKDLRTFRNTLDTTWIGGVLKVKIEKFEVEVCSYSKKLPYRHQENGFKPVMDTRYRYTYTLEGKRLTSKDFRSLDRLMKDIKKQTSKVEMGVTTMEVIE